MQSRLLKILLIAGLGAGLLLPGESQALDLLPGFGTSAGKAAVIWSSGDQYVRLVPQGEVNGKAPAPNDQPVHLDPAQLRMALAGIARVDGNNKVASQAKTTPVFSAGELDVLALALVRGLAQARPDQDLVFMVRGIPKSTGHRKLQAVAGRVFFHAGRLNLIFGDVGKLVGFASIRDVGGYDITPDMRTHPIHVGERAKALPHDWVLSLREGMSFHSSGARGVLRDDWLELDLPKVVAGLQRPAVAAPQPAVATAALAGARHRLREQTMELVAQRQQMQLQLAQMRKQLSQMQSRHLETTTEAGPRGAVARLSLLDKLRREKLITQQEYDAKRREILGQL